MATIKEVARRAGVSVGTVSNVLTGNVVVSGRLRAKVEAAIRDLQYRPDQIARSLKTRQTKMIGIIVSDIKNCFYSELVRGAEDVAVQRGYILVPFSSDDDERREDDILGTLQSRRMDGMLLCHAKHRTEVDSLRVASANGLPMVCLDRVPDGLEADSVTADNFEGARECVRHLLSLGHRRIATVAGIQEMQVGKERLCGYRSALQEAGVAVDEELIIRGGFDEDRAHRAVLNAFKKRRQFTALFVANNRMTIGVLRAMQELNLHCPEDLSLAAFDDNAWSDAFRPQLTTVAQPVYDMGARGAGLLIDRLEGKVKEPGLVNIRLSTELRVRQSTANLN